jgi:aldehyde dehydrogenase (NAD+)
VFAENASVVERILDATVSGTGCVNECTVQPFVTDLPFGGVGNSGMGRYRGRAGFEALTNTRGVMYHSARIDPAVRYPPYAKHPLESRIEAKLAP